MAWRNEAADDSQRFRALGGSGCWKRQEWQRQTWPGRRQTGTCRPDGRWLPDLWDGGLRRHRLADRPVDTYRLAVPRRVVRRTGRGGRLDDLPGPQSMNGGPDSCADASSPPRKGTTPEETRVDR